jgi:Leucine-rich repeat (LRR) protein
MLAKEALWRTKGCRALCRHREALKRIEKVRKEYSTRLDISALNLKQIPEEVFNLSNLQDLIVFLNQLTAIPEIIGRLSKLQRLYVDQNNITQLPEIIGSLTNLQKRQWN